MTWSDSKRRLVDPLWSHNLAWGDENDKLVESFSFTVWLLWVLRGFDKAGVGKSAHHSTKSHCKGLRKFTEIPADSFIDSSSSALRLHTVLGQSGCLGKIETEV